MNAHFGFKSICLLFVFMFYLVATKVSAGPAAEEWIDVKVVVNVLDGADASKVDDAIKKANEALAKAKIRLVKSSTDPNAKGDTNGDGGLNRAERDKARENGQEALKKAVGAGKGIKIDIAGNCDANDAGAVGIAIHENPVIIVEPEADVNEFGKAIAHEIGHVLTLDYDKYNAVDVNSLMYGYTGSGTDLEVNEVNEIRKGARIRGTPYFIAPRVLSGGVAVPDGINYSIDGFGAILDNFHDVLVNDPYHPITDPNDPNNQYADIGEITVFADEPFDPNSVFKTTIQLGRLPVGTWNVDSFFDITYRLESGQPLGRAHIARQDYRPQSSALWASIWYDANGLPTTETIVARGNIESEFRGNPHQAEPHNMTLHVEIPIELISLSLVSAQPIVVTCSSQHFDHRYFPDSTPVMLMDQTLPFKFGLSQPCHCPSLSFVLNKSPAVPDPNGNVNIFGCGFEPNIPGRLYVESDSGVIANHPLTTSSDGRLTDAIGVSDSGWGRVGDAGWSRVSFQPSYEGPPENTPQGATGYFKYCPDGEMPGDFNSDCKEDLRDFAIFANDWLKGTEP
jgi:hypothetical protein